MPEHTVRPTILISGPGAAASPAAAGLRARYGTSYDVVAVGSVEAAGEGAACVHRLHDHLHRRTRSTSRG